jgi:hypothetical protein
MKVKKPFTFDIKNALEKYLFQKKLFSMGIGWAHSGMDYNNGCSTDTTILVTDNNKIWYNSKPMVNHLSFKEFSKITETEK